jgi:hypothetical protein
MRQKERAPLKFAVDVFSTISSGKASRATPRGRHLQREGGQVGVCDYAARSGLTRMNHCCLHLVHHLGVIIRVPPGEAARAIRVVEASSSTGRSRVAGHGSQLQLGRRLDLVLRRSRLACSCGSLLHLHAAAFTLQLFTAACSSSLQLQLATSIQLAASACSISFSFKL